MFGSESRLRKENKRLKDEIMQLKKDKYELESTIKYFNQRVRILNEKEDQYNKMLAELDVLKVHYEKAITQAKLVKKQMKEEIKKFK